jgi:hypothetical protein
MKIICMSTQVWYSKFVVLYRFHRIIKLMPIGKVKEFHKAKSNVTAIHHLRKKFQSILVKARGIQLDIFNSPQAKNRLLGAST